MTPTEPCSTPLPRPADGLPRPAFTETKIRVDAPPFTPGKRKQHSDSDQSSFSNLCRFFENGEPVREKSQDEESGVFSKNSSPDKADTVLDGELSQRTLEVLAQLDRQQRRNSLRPTTSLSAEQAVPASVVANANTKNHVEPEGEAEVPGYCEDIEIETSRSPPDGQHRNSAMAIRLANMHQLQILTALNSKILGHSRKHTCNMLLLELFALVLTVLYLLS